MVTATLPCPGGCSQSAEPAVPVPRWPLHARPHPAHPGFPRVTHGESLSGTMSALQTLARSPHAASTPLWALARAKPAGPLQGQYKSVESLHQACLSLVHSSQERGHGPATGILAPQNWTLLWTHSRISRQPRDVGRAGLWEAWPVLSQGCRCLP